MPSGIGVSELLILLVVVLLVFGPKRLPEIGRSLGSGIRELRDSLSRDEAREARPREIDSPEPDFLEQKRTG